MGGNQSGGFHKDEYINSCPLVKTMKLSRYRIEVWLDGGLWERELGVLIDHKLNIRQHYNAVV